MEPWLWDTEGSRVYGEYHAPRRRRKAVGGVLFVHGFPSSLREFGAAPALMAQAGFHCLAFDQRGFGASGGERGRMGLDRFIPDLDGAIARLRQEIGDGLPVGVVGHSMGAALALGYLSRRDGVRAAAVAHTVDRLLDEAPVLARPALHVLGRMNRSRLRRGRPSWTLRTLLMKQPYQNMFVDPAAAEAARNQPFLQERLNLANYEFASTMQAARWARRVQVPTLCIQSEQDRIVNAGTTKAVHEAIAGPTRTLEHAGGHSCFLDLDRRRVIDGCIDWFNRHLGGLE